MRRPMIPKIKVEFEVKTLTGDIVHSGLFNYADELERKAFQVRSAQAMKDGFEIVTRRRAEKTKGLVVTPGSFLGLPYETYKAWQEMRKEAALLPEDESYFMYDENEKETHLFWKDGKPHVDKGD